MRARGLQLRLNSQLQQVCYAKVSVLLEKEWDPEKRNWDVRARLEHFESLDSPKPFGSLEMDHLVC